MNKQWITDREDEVYELHNLLVLGDNGGPFKLKRVSMTAEELLAAVSYDDDSVLLDLNIDNVLMAYYRMQVMLYANIVYDFSLVKDSKRAAEIIETNNNMTEEPYNYLFDNNDYVSVANDDYVELTIPTEWFAVIPAEAAEVVDMLGTKRDRERALDQLFYNYLIKTLPMEIK